MKKILRYVLLLLVVAFIVIQFFGIERVNEPLNPQSDMISILGVTGEVKTLLQSSCYDCHSDQPQYPWYASLAPVSWWLEEHIEHGREELNFSKWGTYSKRRRDHKLEEMAEEVEEGHMPLPSYTWMHGSLNDEEKALLVSWVEEARAKVAVEEE